jgi:non-specific serine/threonine protein kinase
VLTIINLLAPDHFKVSQHHPRRLEKLRATLLPNNWDKDEIRPNQPSSSSVSKDHFELVINLREQFPQLFVRNHGERLVSLRGVPNSLAYFIGEFFYPIPMHRNRFQQHLTEQGNRYPLVVEMGTESLHVEWDSSLTCQTHTELDVTNGQVHIRPRYLLNEVPCENIKLFWGFAVDVANQKLFRVQESAGLDLYDELYYEWTHGLKGEGDYEGGGYDQETRFWERFNSQTEYSAERSRLWIVERFPISVPLKRFQTMQLNIPLEKWEVMSKHVGLKVNGADAAPLTPPQPHAPESPQYKLIITPPSQAQGLYVASPPKATVRIELWWGDYPDSPHGHTFSFFTYLERFKGVPPPLRTQKRRKILCETFLALLAIDQKLKVEGVLRQFLSGNEWHRHEMKRAAKNILKDFFAAFWEPEVRVQFRQGQWHVVPIPKAKEAYLYQLLSQQFGPQVFQGMVRHDEMSVPVEYLYQGLPQLFEAFREVNVEVFFRNKPVAIPNWEFSLDVKHPAGIDWFELRPEIRCNGMLLSETGIHQAMKGEGFLEMDDVVHVFPIPVQSVFKSFTSFFGNKAEAKGKKPEVLRVSRLQILDWITLRKQGVQVTLPPEDEAIIQQLTHFERIEMPPLPQKLLVTLRPYQQSGYAWFAFLYRHRFGACLADDMGLGKTLQAISLMAAIKEGAIPSVPREDTPHLVVLPPSLLFNWEQEISKFYPALRVHMYVGADRTLPRENCDVILTTYGLVRRDIALLEKQMFHLIVFDEAQAVKNMSAGSTRAVRRLRGAFKIVMTGTPLENHIGEYYALIDLCVPGLLDEFEKMKSSVKSTDSLLLDKLTRRTKPFVLRRTKEKILKELPPKVETDVYLDLTERQKALYQETIEQIRPTIAEAYQTKTQAQARIIALTAILKLRQICLSPRLLQPTTHDSSPKVSFLLDRLTELMEVGHSALVFSQFTSFLDIVEQALAGHHISFRRLDGSTPTGKRKKLVQGFQDEEGASVFLLSLKAGGQGLNLTKASYVFHLDPWWNPAVEQQASDRTHRIGQTQKVSIIRILMRHSIEEKMMALNAQKRSLYEAVLAGSVQKGAGASLSKADFDFLLE